MNVREAIYWAAEFTDKELDDETNIGQLFLEVNDVTKDEWSFWAFVNSV